MQHTTPQLHLQQRLRYIKLQLGKSWACKHWKIQNSYFVISLSFFFSFFLDSVCRFEFVLAFFRHFLVFFWSFFGHFFVICLSCFCHLVCHLLVISWFSMSQIARHVFVPVLLACQRSAGSALLPPIAANLTCCFTTTSMHSCHVSTHALDHVGSG